MRKQTAVLMITAISLLAISTAFAHDDSPWHLLKVRARGFAVSTEDPNVFKLVKIKIVGRNVTHSEEAAVFWRGVMKVSGEKLQINNVTFSNNTVTGNLYRDNVSVGSFTVTSTVVDEKKVWFGTMTLDNQTYHLYLLAKWHKHKHPLTEETKAEIKKEFKMEDRTELREKVEIEDEDKNEIRIKIKERNRDRR